MQGLDVFKIPSYITFTSFGFGNDEIVFEVIISFICEVIVLGLGQMTETHLLKLEEICRQHNVMLVIARSYGLAGLVRISVRVRRPVGNSSTSARILPCLSHCMPQFWLF